MTNIVKMITIRIFSAKWSLSSSSSTFRGLPSVPIDAKKRKMLKAATRSPTWTVAGEPIW